MKNGESVDNKDILYEIKKSKSLINKTIPNKVKVVGKNESQKNLIKSIKNNEITIASGLAGCGKTYIALAYALNLLQTSTNNYKNIYLVKSVTTLKNEEMGFLKGDVNEKLEPIMWSFMLNMSKLVKKSGIETLILNEIIKPLPLAYIRGVTLDNCIIIADEMQNVTVDNSRTLMTRIGTDSKLIMLGDINQIDLKRKKESSLDILIKMFDNIDKIGVVRFNDEDINIRNPLITVIEEKYREFINEYDYGK